MPISTRTPARNALRPVWRNINDQFVFQSDPLSAPFFHVSPACPQGMTVVLRIQDKCPQVLLPGEGNSVRDSLAPCTAHIRTSIRRGDILYIALPAGVTWEGMHRLLSPAHRGGEVVDSLVRCLDQSFDMERTEDATDIEEERARLMEELGEVLRLFVPGTIYCREVATLESHVTPELVGQALSAHGGNCQLAREAILQEFLTSGLVCAFRPGDLDRWIASLTRPDGTDSMTVSRDTACE